VTAKATEAGKVADTDEVEEGDDSDEMGEGRGGSGGGEEDRTEMGTVEGGIPAPGDSRVTYVKMNNKTGNN
jgi:hypothetical protein